AGLAAPPILSRREARRLAYPGYRMARSGRQGNDRGVVERAVCALFGRATVRPTCRRRRTRRTDQRRYAADLVQRRSGARHSLHAAGVRRRETVAAIAG